MKTYKLIIATYIILIAAYITMTFDNTRDNIVIASTLLLLIITIIAYESLNKLLNRKYNAIEKQRDDYRVRCLKAEKQSNDIINANVELLCKNEELNSKLNKLTVPFSETIHQCKKCGSDDVRETKCYYICNTCKGRERK